MSWIEPVRIPTNVEQPDKVIGSFTAHQVAILAGTGSLLYLVYLALGDHVPLAVFAGVALPIGVTGLLLAVGTHEGISLDRYLLAALAYLRAPKLLTSAPVTPSRVPRWLAVNPGPTPAPLRLPARGVGSDGLIDLGPDGVVAVAEVSTLSFALRTPDEQDGLVAGFGRWLNALSGPVQILVRAQPVDLTATVLSLREGAEQLPHPALAAAAREHAGFLQAISTEHDVLRRQVLLIIREPVAGHHGRDAAAARAMRRISEAAQLLGAIGCAVHPLDADAVIALLTACFDPGAPPTPAPTTAADQVIIQEGSR
jgi:hypothetical protein